MWPPGANPAATVDGRGWARAGLMVGVVTGMGGGLAWMRCEGEEV